MTGEKQSQLHTSVLPCFFSNVLVLFLPPPPFAPPDIEKLKNENKTVTYFNYCLFSINNAAVAQHQVPQLSQQHFHFIPSFNQLDVARGNFCLPPGLKIWNATRKLGLLNYLKLKSNRMCSKVGIKLRVNIYSRGFAGSVLHYQEQLCDNLYDVPCLEHEVPLPLDRLWGQAARNVGLTPHFLSGGRLKNIVWKITFEIYLDRKLI